MLASFNGHVEVVQFLVSLNVDSLARDQVISGDPNY
jgi:hypothetical protein